MFFIILSGEQLSQEFARINPFRKVPVIDDNGFILTERYLAMAKWQLNIIEKFYLAKCGYLPNSSFVSKILSSQ